MRTQTVVVTGADWEEGELGMARRFAVAVAVMLFALLVVAAPSWAHHKAGHSQGGGKSAAAGSSNGKSSGGGSGSTYTEDNDTNDGGTPNNVSDAGDNAHPSGKDKSVEPGNSGNQGNSSSDPDDDGRGPDRSNGGPDKPNGSGGVDLADQDGNNGCGNDDDFEDDNEGWCGKNPKRKNAQDKVLDKETKTDDETDVCEKDETMADDVECGTEIDSDDLVLGEVFTKVDAPFDLDEDAPEDRVLGEELVRNPQVDDSDEVAAQPLAREATTPETAAEGSGVLPFTGSNVMNLVLTGLALIAAGLLVWKVRTTR
jgi:hypothetical protein